MRRWNALPRAATAAIEGGMTVTSHSTEAVGGEVLPSSLPLPLPTLRRVREDLEERVGSGSVVPAGQAVRGLYDAFNARDVEAAASFLSDDCVYEDLLMGEATVCRSKASFIRALKYHPAFIMSSMSSSTLPMPNLNVVVDSVAEAKHAVGVEWHVEVNGRRLWLGRGLSHAIVDPETGLITRVVDICEAPWRVVGTLLAPLGMFLGLLS